MQQEYPGGLVDAWTPGIPVGGHGEWLNVILVALVVILIVEIVRLRKEFDSRVFFGVPQVRRPEQPPPPPPRREVEPFPPPPRNWVCRWCLTQGALNQAECPACGADRYGREPVGHTASSSSRPQQQQQPIPPEEGQNPELPFNLRRNQQGYQSWIGQWPQTPGLRRGRPGPRPNPPRTRHDPPPTREPTPQEQDAEPPLLPNLARIHRWGRLVRTYLITYEAAEATLRRSWAVRQAWSQGTRLSPHPWELEHPWETELRAHERQAAQDRSRPCVVGVHPLTRPTRSQAPAAHQGGL